MISTDYHSNASLEKANKRFNNIPINFEDLFETDRPTLGRNIDVVVYRALILSIINHLGFNSLSKLYHAGEDFGKNLGVKSIDDMIYCFKSLGIGILELVSKNPIKIQVYECIFCSGLPNIGEPVCYFEQGMISGCLNSILNKEVKVIETKCYATGYDYCEFDVKILKK
ncbi:MAG TPA: hypothetical protein EYG76_05015 [Methanothermococcus okinawensis]|uniref:4-vinyl reductase 4VR domain-containing protein n=1 Tax=Methanothermococcus okinawensis TaxID=155863 RepID=A0A833DRZ3_9EURY|nr:hypothetical protein [Methanothermococcus okinawensis]